MKLSVPLQQESVWLSQTDMIQLFGRDKSVISRHISNVFKEGELVKSAVVAKFAITARNAKRFERILTTKSTELPVVSTTGNSKYSNTSPDTGALSDHV